MQTESRTQMQPSDTRTLIGKYDGRGPRYTSYPTAPQLSNNFDLENMRREVTIGSSSRQPLSLYVHVPFCRDICYYCACNKVVTREAGVSRTYLDQLTKEVNLLTTWLDLDRPVTQLHWGGGTPSYLDGAEMTELMHILGSNFDLIDSDAREYAIELDPRTVDSESIALLKGLGFNRVSLGIQDFDPLVQKTINRIQPFHMVEELVRSIRRHGFKSLSFDLIYGLPYQDTHTTRATLNRVIELQPDRIACYNYAHLPERFTSQRAIDRHTLPTAENRLEIQLLVAEILSAAGYHHIGMDHYVTSSDELLSAQRQGRLQRNFQGYSINMAPDLIGIGPSAISSLGIYRFQNETDLNGYYQRIANNEHAAVKGLQLHDDDQLRGHIIMALICNLALDFTELKRLFGINFHEHFHMITPRIREFCDDGLAVFSTDQLLVTELGRPFLRNLCMIFDAYLTPITDPQTSTSYSKTL